MAECPEPLGHHARTLSTLEADNLLADTDTLSEFKQSLLELEAKKHWDKFYLRNETRFFKDRHWTKREFEELVSGTEHFDRRPVLLEIGCGVGNFIFPLIESRTRYFILACDFSPRAVEFVQQNPKFDVDRGKAFVCDLTTDELLTKVHKNSVDVVTMIFMLSAIHPEKMSKVIKNVYDVLRPGGVVLFRDYGLYDQAQLRFKKGHKLQDNFYVRQDGTRAYYFSEERTRQLFEGAGFDTDLNAYVTRTTVNKKEGLSVPRIFVQSKFIKPNTEKSAMTSS